MRSCRPQVIRLFLAGWTQGQTTLQRWLSTWPSSCCPRSACTKRQACCAATLFRSPSPFERSPQDVTGESRFASTTRLYPSLRPRASSRSAPGQGEGTIDTRILAAATRASSSSLGYCASERRGIASHRIYTSSHQRINTSNTDRLPDGVTPAVHVQRLTIPNC